MSEIAEYRETARKERKTSEMKTNIPRKGEG